jgi:hypothetical protein
VLYLFGDSTESNLDFNFLAFLPEVIDAAVVLAECEVMLAVTVERRHTRQREAEAQVAAVDDFGERATQVVGPAAEAQAGTPVGRCAARIVAAIREAVEREASQVRGALAAERDELDREDQRLQGRAKDALEKLLRTHDLPGADKALEVVWTAVGVKATMRQRTSFGVEAVLAMDIPPSSVLGLDLRVDRIAEGVEVHTVGAGGWLKKSDKLVAHKLGRYHVVGISIGPHVTVQLRVTPDANAAGVAITAYGNGDLTIESTGGGPGLAIEDRDRPGLRLLAERLEAAARSLGDNRAGLVTLEIDGKPIAEHGHPRVLAERLMIAIAPIVQKIARHSRSPGELVLRRLLGDNRREEIFVSVADLVRRLDRLPAPARTVFESLELGTEAPAPEEPKQPPAPPAPPPPAVEAKVSPVPLTIPEARSSPNRTAPPPITTYDKQRPLVPLPDTRRAARPSAPPPVIEPHDPDEEESTVVISSSSAVAAGIIPAMAPRTHSPTMPPALSAEAKSPLGSARHAAVIIDDPPTEAAIRKRHDDATVSKSIEAALDDDELPSAT